uniref:Uncharacterized protein n=1 Tax=Theileria annulata TaxID=5874 RepID=A0A3B0MR10_THEAN
MSYRYLRHGLLTRRTKLSKNGFHPFIDNLMWDITNYHYKYYMKNVSLYNTLNNQKQIEKILSNCTDDKDLISYFRCAVPQIVPYKSQSNPFCPNSSNKTGFQFIYKNLFKYPRPFKNRQLAINDLRIPVYPKH